MITITTIIHTYINYETRVIILITATIKILSAIYSNNDSNTYIDDNDDDDDNDNDNSSNSTYSNKILIKYQQHSNNNNKCNM